MKATYEEVAQEIDKVLNMYVEDKLTFAQKEVWTWAIYADMGWNEEEYLDEMERRIK